ncbi:MAG: hypothetical protein SNH79_00865 [Rikenellaceae bacterium]
MTNILNIAKHRLLAPLAALLLSFVSLHAAAAQGVKVHKLSKVEMRSFNEIAVIGSIENSSANDITVSGAKVSLKLHGSDLAALSQVGVATAPANSTSDVAVATRIDNIDPMNAMTLMGMVSQMKFDGVTADVEADFSVGENEKRIVERNIDLTNIMTIFAPK